MRKVLAGIVMSVALVPSAHAQSTIAPVVVEVAAAAPVRVRIAAGTAIPCDSTANVPLFEAMVRPGAPMAIRSDALCVCWQQTSPAFPNNGWSSPALQCRPRECVSRKTCLPSLTKPLRIVAH